jgi:hypothetical protein
MKSRGINPIEIPPGAYCYDSHYNAIAFLDNNERLINRRVFVPVNGSPKSLNKGELKNSVYTALYKSDKKVFVHEGVINTMSMIRQSTIAIFSTSNNINKPAILKSYLEGKDVILSFDSDVAGKKCTDYYLDFIRSNLNVKSIKQINWPDGKDANDLLIDGNLEVFMEDETNYDILFVRQEDPIDSEICTDTLYQEGDLKKLGFYIKNDCYYTPRGQLSNFVMEILYLFDDGTNDAKRLIKLQHEKGNKYIVEADSSETSKSKFETILKSKGCSFIGPAKTWERLFMHLMQFERNALQIQHMGYNKQFEIYAFSNCVISEHNSILWPNKAGIVDCGEQYLYLPTASYTDNRRKEFDTQQRFSYKIGEVGFTEWSDLLYNAYGVNGAIGLCFFINALFRDIIFKELNFIPYLFLFGEAGVGKSSYIDFLLRPFGDKDVGISIKGSTPKAIIRSISQKSNAIIFLKEYDSSISRDMIALFKNGYDGAGYSIAQKSTDKKTETINLESSVIIDGNVLPASESALFDRMVVLRFEKDRFSESEKKAFKSLLDISEFGLGQIIHEILQYRSVFEKCFKSEFRKLHSELTDSEIKINEVKITSLPERTLKHITYLLTPYSLLSTRLKFPISFEELVQKLIEDAVEKSGLLNELKDVSIFWDAIAWEMQRDFSRIRANDHYIIDYDNCILYIKVPLVIPFYNQYCKENNIQTVDKSTLLALLHNPQHGFLPNNQKGGKSSYNKHGFGRCDRFTFGTTHEKNNIKIGEKLVYLK